MPGSCFTAITISISLWFHINRSINEVICHGIPDSRLLEDGDILNSKLNQSAENPTKDLSNTSNEYLSKKGLPCNLSIFYCKVELLST